MDRNRGWIVRLPAVHDTTASGAPPLVYLSGGEVEASMPPLEERLRLAERALVALATPGSAEMPPKLGVHPRPAGAFSHAMPAHLRADGETPAGDLVGLKWVTVFPGNAARGLAAIHAVVVLNDPATGLPTAILDGGPITADRTAAVSGVAIRRFAPRIDGRSPRAAILGAGVQGRSHLAILGATLPGVELTVFDRHPERAAALAERAAATPGIAGASIAPSARAAVEAADVAVTAASFAPPGERQAMTADWLAPHALVVAVDYATYCSASLARGADLFVVDERVQFLANRDAGLFEDYPDPDATLGEAILAGTPRPPGRVVVTHLGVGLADLVFADAIVRAALAGGTGTTLPR